MRKHSYYLIPAVLLVLLSLFLSLVVYGIIGNKWFFTSLGIIGSIVILINFFRLFSTVRREIEYFTESLTYRDFSRNYNVRSKSGILQPLIKSFNEVNKIIREINVEKEAQNQYLEKIVSMIDTAVIAYEVESGKIIWMNDTFKELLLFPQFRSIEFLASRNARLYEAILSIPNGRSKIETITISKLPIKLWFTATQFVTNNISIRLIAIKNVEQVVDETEAKAWQKLLSVMTHEIMNSIAPISSLADTLKRRLAAENLQKDEFLQKELEIGIDTIRTRSEGLLKFAKTYRHLNNTTQPNLELIYVRDLLERILQLMLPMLEQKKIEAHLIFKTTNLQVAVDIYLIEQVLINLFTNAIEALKEKQGEKNIYISASQNDKKIILKIADDGTGIEKEVIDSIFVPFFSTKKGGSGIGLSLCRQIMLLHKGLITVQSKSGYGTVFALQFPVIDQGELNEIE
ncbi:sensor histidine kinase [Gynurincola endophyticus]|jgi:two-component system nitrogen regulation sensor histidine kinase NtrY|uniref:sensor histidine kinase n=1 Tax=Gynurincola endophyticus TaxID=2479004 RepID=UPI000F8CDD6C|nr:HAMP domain-containing sensor histidine kinase [Gynurincola endophyticus]